MKKQLSMIAQSFVAGLILLAFLGLSPGSMAPQFKAQNQDGNTVQLSDSKGKFVLIYFYPKDDTPGCRKEACSFRDQFEKIKKMNTVIFGVSRQDERSHLEFKKKHHLPFDLLADPDGKLAEAFGVGKMFVIGFTKRQSILIDPQGKVVKFYESVDPETHVAEVLADIEKASAPALSDARTTIQEVLSNPTVWKDENQQSRVFSEWAGTSLVLTMIYTDCKKTCPLLTMKKLKEIQKKLDETKQTAEFIVGTMDPEQDTPDVLLSFKKRNKLGKNWHFIHGTQEETRRFAKQIGLDGYWTMDDHINHKFRIVFYHAPSKKELSLDYGNQDVSELFSHL